MRYDAAIIGAGANGLTAAAVLARAGLKTVLIERAHQPGGRLFTEEFHPGHSASLFADRVPDIPLDVTAALGLQTRLTVESPPSDIRARRDGALAHIFAEAREPFSHGVLARLRRLMAPVQGRAGWPGQDLAARPLADWPALTHWALLGRAIDPELAGSAMALLALAGAEPQAGGLGSLGWAFAAAATGAELRLGQEAVEVELKRGRFGSRVSGLHLGDGSRIEAGAVISTLDFKHSILSVFPWASLPPALRTAAAQWRMGGGTARLLLALNAPARTAAPLLLPGDANFRAAFRARVVPSQPPLLVDPVSLRDPRLAPEGGATVTVTLAGIPARLFHGDWSEEVRTRLAAAALRRIEQALPGTLASLKGVRTVVAAHIEARLGVTDGDLDGGQLAPDQMLGLRPGARTELAGYYLGGASTAAGPLGTGAAGFAAALALLADRA